MSEASNTEAKAVVFVTFTQLVALATAIAAAWTNSALGLALCVVALALGVVKLRSMEREGPRRGRLHLLWFVVTYVGAFASAWVHEPAAVAGCLLSKMLLSERSPNV